MSDTKNGASSSATNNDESTWNKEARDFLPPKPAPIDVLALELERRQESERKYKELHGPTDKIIAEWRKENHPDYTRVILKIVNNTKHTFQLTETSRPLTQAEIAEVRIPPGAPTPIIMTSEYFGLDDGKGVRETYQFGHYLDFESGTAGFKLIVGLGVEGGHNFARGNWRTPLIAHQLTSTGTTPIKGTTTLTAASKKEPFNFEVLIVLG